MRSQEVALCLTFVGSRRFTRASVTGRINSGQTLPIAQAETHFSSVSGSAELERLENLVRDVMMVKLLQVSAHPPDEGLPRLNVSYAVLCEEVGAS